MYDAVREAALNVAPRIFETMFFTSLVPPELCRHDIPLLFAPPILQSEIGFQGKYTGKLRLSLSLELAKLITVNFMGLAADSEVPESQTSDAVGELCNIICGNLFRSIDKKTSHVLTIPQTRIVSAEDADVPGSEPGFALDFVAQRHLVRLDVRLNINSKKMRRPR
jgi:CheY-specific phosphatase CheX